MNLRVWLLQSITQTATGIVPTGVAGLAGNKGGVGIRFLCSICFVLMYLLS